MDADDITGKAEAPVRRPETEPSKRTA